MRRDRLGPLDPGPHCLEAIRSLADQLCRCSGRCWGWLLAAPPHACGTGWASKTEELRDAVKIAVIDWLAPYASGIRAALRQMRLADTTLSKCTRSSARGGA
jgi:hypothetical protein